MYHKFILTLLLSTLGCGATAQVKPSGKKPTAVKAAAVEDVKPTGPLGFGPVKIGMSKEELESLTESDGVYLTKALTPKDEKYSKPPEGTTRFEGVMTIPLSPTPVKTTFSFRDSKLNSFAMELHEVAFDVAQKQIASKYGAGELKEDKKEEQCIYKNGSNFKLTNGTKTVSWRQSVSDTHQITTQALDMQFAMCPSSLDLELFSRRIRVLSVEDGPVKSENKKNLF